MSGDYFQGVGGYVRMGRGILSYIPLRNTLWDYSASMELRTHSCGL